MRSIRPHQLFRFDFDQILEEGKRQEEIDLVNGGEFALVKNLHHFFSVEVLPLILTNDWVFEGANSFASEYVDDCFRNLRLSGEEIYKTQQKLVKIKELVSEFLARAKLVDAVSFDGIIRLTKSSDFISFVHLDKLEPRVQRFALQLFEKAKDHEELQLRVVLRGIKDSYEMTFTRVMFVVRRALKVKEGLPETKSDTSLLPPSDYIDWLHYHTDKSHILNKLFVQEKEFYRVSRNVGNHHLGLKWIPQEDEIILPDRNQTLAIHVDDFHKRFRYLIHFCELGVRGILSAFCEKDRGELSDRIVKNYTKSFPENWSQGQQGIMEFYSQK
ncbi:MAG: hypothetical protein H6657_06020 [Ardenticatenaceae bacterium]|nr:hypothetical protein [Ardenticatenaceae bacterium]